MSGNFVYAFICTQTLTNIFVQFPDETLRSGELLNMIVAVIDSMQVRLQSL